MNGPSIATWGFAVIAAILLGFAAIVLWKILIGEIKLDDLISEPSAPGMPAKASLSRFQFLLFTFVVAGLFLLLSIEAGTFVEVPSNVLGLLGISGGSYVVAKAVGNVKKEGEAAGDGAATKADAAKAAAAEEAAKAEALLRASEVAAARAVAAADQAVAAKAAAEAAAKKPD